MRKPKLHLCLAWTRRPDGTLTCGSVTIEYRPWCWHVFVDGFVVSPAYASKQEAVEAAPRLRAVRRLGHILTILAAMEKAAKERT